MLPQTGRTVEPYHRRERTARICLGLPVGPLTEQDALALAQDADQMADACLRDWLAAPCPETRQRMETADRRALYCWDRWDQIRRAER